MLRPIARLLILTLVLGSGRLLACGWECDDAAAAAVEVACHHESPDSGAPLIGGVAHECPPEASEPVVAAANKVEQQVIGAFVSPSQWTGFDQPASGRVVTRTLGHRVSVPPPSLFNVLRI